MARTNFHKQDDYLQTSFQLSVPKTASDFPDNLEMSKCPSLKPPRYIVNRNHRRKNVKQCSNLEVIPETCPQGVCNNNCAQAEKRVTLKCEDNVNSVRKHAIANPYDTIKLFQRSSNDYTINQAQRSLYNDNFLNSRTLGSGEADKLAFSFAMRQPLPQNHRSIETNSELKSGILIWISHAKHTNGVRDDGNKNAIYNNAENIGSNLNNPSLRIPVMLKIYRYGSGNFALMTPSRSNQGQTQPLYIRLKNSHVTMLDTTYSPLSSKTSSSPCCFLLTLGVQDGKSFKFEASSKAVAEKWVHTLNISAATRSRYIMPIATTSEDSNNTWHSSTKVHINENDKNINNYNNDNRKIQHDSIMADTSNLLSSSSKAKTPETNQHRPIQPSQTRPNFFTGLSNHSPNYEFQRESRMPTLSESSDETEEAWSEED
ncbi:hypothetical protein EGW08_007029 [Elysia chlorotica]|uniref:PH domain-containing protein n=1 Tax=Elysia chlorotica TaxID=188477 RepID=A0A3S0ZRN8_ELYCH|nr:hypothetical protein EGW08_007029 [Elysia chlorotica]